jgi:hypothetical protein
MTLMFTDGGDVASFARGAYFVRLLAGLLLPCFSHWKVSTLHSVQIHALGPPFYALRIEPVYPETGTNNTP